MTKMNDLKSESESMTPDAAAKALFGRDQDSFTKSVNQLAVNDPRLAQVFENVRQRYLADTKE